MATFLVYSTSDIISGEKVCRELKMAANLKILKDQTQLQFDFKYGKIFPNYDRNFIFHDDDVIDYVTGWPKRRPSIFLYKWNNNAFHDNKKRAKISSLNFLCIGIMRLWLHLYKCAFVTSLMTPPGHKVCHILKLISVNIWARASIKSSKYRKC